MPIGRREACVSVVAGANKLGHYDQTSVLPGSSCEF